jgi:hypothetical protein
MLDNQEEMCNKVVPVIFPTLQRLKTHGYRVRMSLVSAWHAELELNLDSDLQFVEDCQKRFDEVK